MLHRLLTCAALLLPFFLLGQIPLAEAEINGEAVLRPGYLEADSLVHQATRGQDLGAMLSVHGWNVLAGGASGQLRQLRVGGFSPEYTTLWWNGLELNSLTLGSTDLSLVPAFLFPATTFSALPDAAAVPGSAMAGSIDLKGARDSSRLFFESSLSSLQNATVGVRIKGSLGKAIHQTAWHSTLAKNTFSFTDGLIGDGTEKNQVRNDHKQHHFLSQWRLPVGARTSGTVAVWATLRDLEIPPLEGSFGSRYGMQNEKALRLTTQWKSLRRHLWRWGSAHVFEHFQYDQAQCDTCALVRLSHIPTHRQVGYAGATFSRANGLPLLDVELRLEHAQVNAETHGGLITELNPSVRLRLPMFHRRLVASAHYTAQPGLLPNATLTWRSKEKARLQTRVQLGHRSRMPDFNERYWQPGGNPAILPESGWTGSANAKRTWRRFEAEFQVNVRGLRNAIQWLHNPSINDFSPVNASRAQHMSFAGFMRWNHGEWSAQTNATFQYATLQLFSEADWIRPAYLPSWIVNALLNRQVGTWNAYAKAQLQSRRKSGLSASNPDLDAFVLLDAGAGKTLKMGFRIEVQVLNLLNTNYRILYTHPMPGRVYQLNLIYALTP